MNFAIAVLVCLSGILQIAIKAQEESVATTGRGRPTDEQRLLKKLRENYDSSVRPVFDATHPVVIRLGITLTQVLDVDEKNQVLSINVWLDQEWRDEKLVWNTSDYANITVLRVPCDLLWLPDIVLYNSVDNHNKRYMRSLAMVANDGNVFWPPIVRFRSSCKMDITYFPFDDQVCRLKMGSWAYDGFQVDVFNRTSEVDLSNFVDNGEWTLVDTKVVRNVIFYPCCDEPFPDVTFYIHLRRRVLYYFFNVIIPCMLLSSLSLTGFLLPPDSGEKVTLGLTVLLAFSVFMLLVAENMPPTSEYIPLIGIYLTVIMAMSAISVALSVFVLNCHHKGGLLNRPPVCIKFIANIVGKILCMRLNYLGRSERPSRPSFQEVHEDQSADSNVRTDYQHDPHRLDLHMNGLVESAQRPRAGGTPSNGGVPSSNPVATMEKEIVRYLRLLMEAYERGRAERVAVNEWQEIARVMDKFFFTIFLTITLVSTFVLLIISPMTKTTAISDYSP
ncbi:neuronal acetylcholine receptor subunit alpha-10-like [Haliotis rubra]|uniref:neuronal acetylcholine receptor subunit alpha-10-like n=1 Tax=Haliotis rubra TaxID=36100 RepID=UPI001EE53210|nr:neuronal acetylcholine receptor subunit alpha-10-like [Haliotis rubra]